MKNKDCNEELIAHTYKELNKDNDGSSALISKSLIEDVIVNGQSLFAKATIEKGLFQDVTFKYFGKFKARHSIIQKLYSKLHNKKNKEKLNG